MNKTCIIIAGPTAVGKTALAIDVARYYDTEIISADSRQCYKEMNIAVAKPSPEELLQVPHHFINHLSIHEKFTSADYERFALNFVEDIFKRKDIVIMCGGTGLYIRAFADGLDDIPAIPAAIRSSIEIAYAENGIAWLIAELKKSDSLYASQGEMLNPNRMMRALEVFKGTGKSILEYQMNVKKQRAFKVIKICLEMPRAQLYERIDHRVNQMMDAGLEAEARSLLPFRDLSALQTVGYREMFAYFDGTITLDNAVSLIKQNTRRYAKRQITWFKKESQMHFCPAEKHALLSLVEKQYSEQ